jgi:hypothetical protein
LLYDKLIATQEKLIEYAEQVGKVQLLTDNLMTKEQDTKYWQDKQVIISSKTRN